jgi:tRNA(Ile)-lysidine synthase
MIFLDRVRQFVRCHGLFGRDTRVLAAVSGGPDSVALAHLLRELDAAGELRLAGLVHFNHQLRAAAEDDERFVVSLGESLGLPVSTDRGDVAAEARRERRSVEAAGRAARYAFFERARALTGADAVALGHTRDDQAETFLLRLLRGAGPRGLGGMYPRNGYIVRPLLDCRRADLRTWLSTRGLPYVEDETNGDVSIPRNRVRGELLPLLEARFNRGIVDVLARVSLRDGRHRIDRPSAGASTGCAVAGHDPRGWRPTDFVRPRRGCHPSNSPDGRWPH